MALTIDLKRETKEALDRKAKAKGVTSESYVREMVEKEVAAASDELTQRQLTVAEVGEMVLQRFASVPKEASEGLPTDGASQHDHYIYGTPKRTDL